MDIIIGFTIFLCLLLWVYFKRLHNDNKYEDLSTFSYQQTETKPVEKHLGVVLKSTQPENCCESAKKLNNKLINDNSLPSLPLPGCDQEHACSCFFQKKFNERKGQERRTIEERREHIRFEDKKDRRSHGNRRKQHNSVWKKDRY